MTRERNPIIWSTCERCGNPVAMFDHDELCYLMSIHTGLVHFACPTEDDLERILTHANPSARTSPNLRLAGGPQQLTFYASTPGPERSDPRA
jgi:hypothetical protein